MKKLFLCLIAVLMCLGHVNRVSAADYTSITGDNTHGFNAYLLVPEDQEVIDGKKQVGDRFLALTTCINSETIDRWVLICEIVD